MQFWAEASDRRSGQREANTSDCVLASDEEQAWWDSGPSRGVVGDGGEIGEI